MVTRNVERMELPPSPPNLAKILTDAEEHGWSHNPAVSIVARLNKPSDPLALPFYVSYWLVIDKQTGKCAWRFHGAYASNGQPMTYHDVFTYLADPAVIHPEPPEGENCESA